MPYIRRDDGTLMPVNEPRLPYPWCRDPEGCKNRGSCPRDPNCGD